MQGPHVLVDAFIHATRKLDDWMEPHGFYDALFSEEGAMMEGEILAELEGRQLRGDQAGSGLTPSEQMVRCFSSMHLKSL